jgi:hypothetical protein
MYIVYRPIDFDFLTQQMPPKKKPQPLHVSLRLIEEERANMAKRTQARIAMLYPQTDQNVDKATQTEIPMREVLVEIEDWHCCLNTPFAKTILTILCGLGGVSSKDNTADILTKS